ncbi:hypothetical protein K443DRAFT_113700 [Laccaria amethystina LaAM-08-1]|uniref:Uncharacterized protein n=1 Tax=Laccaria amethystina LaAM-08-1 TaxID=1095629 RepID=A0A0C9WNX5_9AGAR|nr:hypothetical protein K443DRAFT_113700 [Laccaria amethystina LaAM-08-1]
MFPLCAVQLLSPGHSLLPEMETKSQAHLRRPSTRCRESEIQRQRIIVRALTFIARMSECIGSE